ncbi:GFA family protein [Halomonas denitrificans]|nr:GFA family protein [Halomonas denitrificans]
MDNTPTRLPLPLNGGCLCGAIRYRITSGPFDADLCHCRQCQLATGGPVAAWMDFRIEQVIWEQGEPREFASSDQVRRGFCPQCGTALTYRNTGYADLLTLSIASLDQPDQVAPRYHLHTNSQCRWLTLADDWPRYPETRC